MLQALYIRSLATGLWQRDDVLAIWLGGSFASGKADRFGGDLLRLYFVLATDKDCGLVAIPPLTIHTITPVAQTIRQHFGDEPMQLVGLPTRNRDQWVVALASISHAMAQIGRQVAEPLDFDYPEELEAEMPESWAAFRKREEL